MTNTEAITKLTNIMHDDHYAWHPSILEAFRMAVDALKGAKGDCINRADVNRVLEDWFRTVFGTDSFRKTGLCRELRELPSAQPSFPQDHEKDHFAEAGKKATQPDVPDTNVGDTISRQAAIDEIKALYEWHDTVTEDRTIDHLKRLPSAQPEQRWIPCSERMPAYGEDVLISIGGYCNVGHIVSVNEEEQYNWYFSGWYHSPNDVDAWMPLPEPWEEGEVDEVD